MRGPSRTETLYISESLGCMQTIIKFVSLNFLEKRGEPVRTSKQNLLLFAPRPPLNHGPGGF